MTITSPLSPEDQKITGEALQASLVDLIDLSLLAKQAHWNVVGERFKSVHEHLDEIVDSARLYLDQVAERTTAIGLNPDGNAATVAKETALESLPPDWVSTDDVVAAVVSALGTLSNRFRDRVKATESADPITQDMLIEITQTLEMQRWMFQAQTY
jgi:starvation-inducible DNA-binding protein